MISSRARGDPARSKEARADLAHRRSGGRGSNAPARRSRCRARALHFRPDVNRNNARMQREPRVPCGIRRQDAGDHDVRRGRGACPTLAPIHRTTDPMTRSRFKGCPRTQWTPQDVLDALWGRTRRTGWSFAEKGSSDCRTRTCDPAVNSRTNGPELLWKLPGCPSPAPWGPCVLRRFLALQAAERAARALHPRGDPSQTPAVSLTAGWSGSSRSFPRRPLARVASRPGKRRAQGTRRSGGAKRVQHLQR
jgi:hypothetical protein